METTSHHFAAAPLKVFIAEDSPIMRPRLAAMVAAEAGFVVCGIAVAAAEITGGVLGTTADAVILDINLVDGSSLAALREVMVLCPGLFVIVCTNATAEPYRVAALAAGAQHFIDKSLECERIPALLRQFHACQRNDQRAIH